MNGTNPNPATKGGHMTRRLTTVLSSVTFGPFSRFRLEETETRGDGLSWRLWLVFDAEVEDEITGGPAIIVMADTREQALSETQRLTGAL